MLNHIGRSDILLITLDTLRYDVAQSLFEGGRLPNLTRFMPDAGWEHRHSPATFTYAAHHAFFAGFLPTPIQPGLHPRLFASEFGGSETISDQTFVFPEATLPQALSTIGYHTICVGGTGFFNSKNALGKALPSLFDESHWSRSMSVVDRNSALHQVECAIAAIERQNQKRVFCFINFSAIHQPNWFFTSNERPADGRDTLASHGEALVEIDRQLPQLFDCFRERGSLFAIVCSDHGTAYGEDGHWGHRLAHPVVWEVPYADFEW
ncbi:STM4013/SEN3800 family hydrolase [Rubinisphaera sp.]|uniref:STM4013/SEN3800 family hydrolase n=1 Tax=Rubinisphaera sp. TaxID=2024857 RepID=UPI000C0CE6ED|nr:STM4013/SEN3800 family hydrolase [Rubinisphaera sp.]MBV11903.1 metalloenzyme domain-containing protein [Rubinisphaera sp.]